MPKNRGYVVKRKGYVYPFVALISSDEIVALQKNWNSTLRLSCGILDSVIRKDVLAENWKDLES